MTNPDWYPDPLGRFEVRYHDGAQWTEHVATGGAASTDPMPAAQPPTFEQVPPQQGGFQPPDQQQTVAFQGPTGPPGPGSFPLQNDGPPPNLGSFPTDGVYQPPGGSGGGGDGGKVVAILAGLAVLAILLVGSAIFLLNRGDDGDVVAGGSTGSAVDEGDADGTNTTAADSTTSTIATTIATTTESTTTTTAATLDDSTPPAASPRAAIPEYGTNPALDELANDCESGDFGACDQLFLVSDIDSGYEDYGDSCGERNRPAGFCVGIYSN